MVFCYRVRRSLELALVGPLLWLEKNNKYLLMPSVLYAATLQTCAKIICNSKPIRLRLS